MNIRISFKAIVLFMCLCICLTPMIGKSQQANAADQLLELIRFNEQISGGREACISRANQTNFDKLYAENPALFFGIAPPDSRWQKIQQYYIDFLKESCVPASLETAAKIAEKTYATSLSPSEVQAAIAFFRTEAGSKFISASENITNLINIQMASEFETNSGIAWKKYEKRSNDLLSTTAEKP